MFGKQWNNKTTLFKGPGNKLQGPPQNSIMWPTSRLYLSKTIICWYPWYLLWSRSVFTKGSKEGSPLTIWHQMLNMGLLSFQLLVLEVGWLQNPLHPRSLTARLPLKNDGKGRRSGFLLLGLYISRGYVKLQVGYVDGMEMYGTKMRSSYGDSV